MATTTLRDLLDREVAFLATQTGGAALLALPSFLAALRGQGALAIHLDDLRREANDLGRKLADLEYDGGRPAGAVQRAWEEAGNKAGRAALDLYGRHVSRFRQLLADFHHPATVPVPRGSKEVMNRVPQLLAIVDEVRGAMADPVIECDSTAYTQVVEHDKEVQRETGVRTFGDPSVALLRLEAVESALLGREAFADSLASEDGAVPTPESETEQNGPRRSPRGGRGFAVCSAGVPRFGVGGPRC